MGIRTDSDLQQSSVEDGHNPYTDEDLAIYKTYTPDEVDLMCEHQDEIAHLFEETQNLVNAISAAIDRLAPVINDVYENLKKLEQEVENDPVS